MKITLLLRVEVDVDPNACSARDLVDGIAARLTEFYPIGDDGFPLVPDEVNVAVIDPRVARHMADALEVGLSGSGDDQLDDAGVSAADVLFHDVDQPLEVIR